MGGFRLFGSSTDKIKGFVKKEALIVDVRTTKEYNVAAIEGSKHIPLRELETHLEKIKKWNKPIITCCSAGVRSKSAAVLLRKHGIVAINGGAWRSLSKKI